MKDLSRVSLLIAASVALSLTAGVVASSAGSVACPVIAEHEWARWFSGLFAFGVVLLVAAQVAMHYLHPPDVRYLRTLSFFVMSATGSLCFGSWVLPLAGVSIVQDGKVVQVTFGDATVVTVFCFPVGLGTLLLLARMYIGRSRQ